jgi:hypothetical protein
MAKPVEHVFTVTDPAVTFSELTVRLPKLHIKVIKLISDKKEKVSLKHRLEVATRCLSVRLLRTIFSSSGALPVLELFGRKIYQ